MNFQLTFIDNASHGYLKVPIDVFTMIVDKPSLVSGYSGITNTHVFLEEDCDAAIFVNAAKAQGHTVSFIEEYNERYQCPKNYNAAKLPSKTKATRSLIIMGHKSGCKCAYCKMSTMVLFLLLSFTAIGQADTSHTVQCIAITKAGTQCTRKTTNCDALCWQHLGARMPGNVSPIKTASTTTPTAAIQCAGITKAGARCRNKTTKGMYCHLHKK